MRFYIVVAVLFALLGVVGFVDMESAEAEQAMYCENVKAKIWPDYKNIFKKVCKDY